MTAARKTKAKRSDDVPGVGVVCADRVLGSRIRRILERAEIPRAFSIAVAELDDGDLDDAAIVVVCGSLRTGERMFSPVRERFPEARVIACGPPGDGQLLRWAVDRGVDGVVWDSRLDGTLLPTIQAVGAGQFAVPQEMLGRKRSDELTNREKQSLSLVLMGLTNREIAQKLFVSESTVKSHLNTAYRKLGVHSRSEAARLIADPEAGLGTGILAITGAGLARGRTRRG